MDPGEGLRILLALLIVACAGINACVAQTPDQAYGMDAEFDEALLKATIPSAMELGETYTVSFRVSNSGVLPGEYTVVLWCESSAIHPHMANRQFLLRPGQVKRMDFSLTGVMPTDEPQTVRAMVLARPSGKLPPAMIWETETEVLRIYPSGHAMSLLPVLGLVALVVLVLAAVVYGLRGRGLKRAREPVPVACQDSGSLSSRS